MLITALVTWWYTAGWSKLADRVESRTFGTLELFSVSLLLRSLFDPFRQISAGRVRGPIGVQLRAWADRLFSRVIGCVVRSMIILVGLITTVAVSAAGLIQLIVWPVIPVLPILAIVAAFAGWTI